MGLELENKANTAEWQSPHRALLAIFTAHSACLGAVGGKGQLSPKEKDCRLRPSPCPAIQEWESELDVIVQDKAVHSIQEDCWWHTQMLVRVAGCRV